MTSERNPEDRAGRPRREKTSRAKWIAALFVLALVGWMGSGYLEERPDAAAGAPRETEREPMAVEVQSSTARPITEFVVGEGQVVPDRQTPVRAKVGGTVEAIEIQKGTFVEEGQLIARIGLADRAAQLAQAQAELTRRQRDFEAISRLAEQGYSTSAKLEESRSVLAAAEAALAQISQTAEETEIRAPIGGVLDRLDLDVGEFVSAGAEVGVQVDVDPLVVEIQIPQQSIGRIERGQAAEVVFITGETREGTIRYIASNATRETRTFPVEVEVPNPDRKIPAGISAQVRVPVGQTPAHLISAALLALGTDGTLGIKTVNADRVVEFYPIGLVRAETDGIWVSGLPEQATIISVGQGFVSAGELVRVIEAAPAGAPESGPALVSEGPESGGSGATPVSLSRDEPESTPDRAQAAATPDSGAAGTASVAQARPGPLLEPRTAGSAAGSAEDIPVRLVQERLQALGYDPGPLDGIMGEGTRTAIRAFQQANGLDVTGAVDAALAAALLRAQER